MPFANNDSFIFSTAVHISFTCFSCVISLANISSVYNRNDETSHLFLAADLKEKLTDFSQLVWCWQWIGNAFLYFQFQLRSFTTCVSQDLYPEWVLDGIKAFCASVKMIIRFVFASVYVIHYMYCFLWVCEPP